MNLMIKEAQAMLADWENNPTVRGHAQLANHLGMISSIAASQGEETVCYNGVWVSPTVLNIVLDSQIVERDLIAA
mgnify:CR=1 FL=1